VKASEVVTSGGGIEETPAEFLRTLSRRSLGNCGWGVRFIELDRPSVGDGVPMVCDEHQLAESLATTIQNVRRADVALDVSQTNRFGERFSAR